VISEREKLEFESLPEFIREPYSAGRESYSSLSQSSTPSPRPSFGGGYSNTYGGPLSSVEDSVLEKTAELEALWPGVNHHEFFQPSRKSPSFFLTIGFLAGAVVSLIGVWGYSFFTSGGINNVVAQQKKIVVAGGGTVGAKSQISSETGSGGTHPIVVGGSEVIVPAFPTYEVQSGDTLAAIALKAYHRASPRLLDEICKANNMRSAHVLNLGQTLTLPEYRPSSQIAAGAGAVQ